MFNRVYVYFSMICILYVLSACGGGQSDIGNSVELIVPDTLAIKTEAAIGVEESDSCEE